MQIVQDIVIKSTGTKKEPKPELIISNPVKKAYTFRIYPSKNQKVKLNRTLTIASGINF